MTGLILCSAMHDEPIWGQYRRLLWVNNRSGSRAADWGETEVAYQSHERHRRIVVLLAGSDTCESLRRYFIQHSRFSQLLSPLSISLGCWRKLLYRWNDLGQRWYCPDCASEDCSRYGFAWFRRAHQFAGVNWCPTHETALCSTTDDGHWTLTHDKPSWRGPDPRGPRDRASPPTAFASRYVQALTWLHAFKNRPDWGHVVRRATLLAGNSGENHERGMPAKLIELVRAAAPQRWLERNQFGLEKPGPVQSTHVALAAAAVTNSGKDLQDLLASARRRSQAARRIATSTQHGDRTWLQHEILAQHHAWLAEKH